METYWLVFVYIACNRLSYFAASTVKSHLIKSQCINNKHKRCSESCFVILVCKCWQLTLCHCTRRHTVRDTRTVCPCSVPADSSITQFISHWAPIKGVVGKCILLLLGLSWYWPGTIFLLLIRYLYIYIFIKVGCPSDCW